nr:elongation factor 1-gamma 2-like [Ipomoea trifida]
MNPIGKVPVLETPEGPVFESNAIARYVVKLKPDNHLPHGGNHRIPAHHSQAASVILAFHEREIENYQQPYLVECRRGVYPLCPSH